MAGDPPLRFTTDFDPRHGEPVILAPGVVRVTAPNASPYTFTGTNSYLLGEDRVILVDPGPDHPGHLAALTRAVAGRAVEAIVLTHTHRDHCGLARAAQARFSAPIWSAGPHRLSRPLAPFERNPFARSGDFTLAPDRLLGANDSVETDGGAWRVVPTPGHCANHIALAHAEGEMALVGDHVMGWSSTLVAAPDGDLRAYLASLERLIALPHETYLPGHGDAVMPGRAMARALLAHRRARNIQILAAAQAGVTRLGRLVRTIYPHLRGRRALAARQTLLAHLDYLAAEGALKTWRTPWGVRFAARGPTLQPPD